MNPITHFYILDFKGGHMKEKITVCLILLTLFSFPILSFIKEKETFSISERRKLETLPKDDLLNFSKWENYLIDHFYERETLKNIKGFITQKLLQKEENKNTIKKNNILFELNTKINENSILHITKIINKITEKYRQTNQVYYSIIPDKNYYTKNEIPKMNYSKFLEIIHQNLKNINYISIFEDLNIDSYYTTDIHWKQPELLKVKETLLKKMNQPITINNYEKKIKEPFYGILYYRLPFHVKPEKIEYLTNKKIENTLVYNYEKKEYHTIYSENYQDLKDGYDMFLDGATPLLIIENKECKSKKELILFRDSFASSITPLLIESYSKITLIDLRYISSNYLENITEITWNENNDILFLYSIPVINNSFTLK